ncbi:UbiD family decarboxylase [Hydrogenophaga sp. BPS33]|uniref:UbiD family decarboxylase n=1 Tax=Hydrogenophaga sp. BPS33 TaxID=2651974 RepID=UPI00131FEF13|nr:UbiD family decarboxylase [Hydrogenophaga sp. BPS33]QHE87097.1 UbiD family decarboxylase [Hydrogenophaga sp. BPS33]
MQGVTSLSAAIEEAQAHDDLLRITREADPYLEVAAIARTTDAGPVVVFDRLRGHEGQRIVTNVFSDRKRIARWCGVEAVDLPRRIAHAALNPIPSRITDQAASQQNVITSGIDLFKTLPLAQQTKDDAGCVITGGLALVRDPDTGAFNGSYHRMRVLGPNLTCITIQAGRHLLEIARKLRARGERHIPISVNIGASPAVLLACSGSTQQTLTPLGYDELGMGGALQGQAVEVAPCKTQEGAWSLAEAEYVLEGYIDTDRLTSEEDSGKDGEKGMMPEAGGYMGRAWRVWEFNVTAITHRHNPVYWFPLAVNAETTNLMALPAEASVFDACQRISPRVFDTCHVLQGMRGCLGVVIRINRKSFRDEGLQNNLAFGALSAHSDLGWVIAVDHDIDLTNADDVMWAVITRSDMREGLMLSPRAKVSGMLAEGDAAGTGRKVYIDATAPFTKSDRYQRGVFENVAIEDWIGAEAAAQLRARQPDYVSSLLARRY